MARDTEGTPGPPRFVGVGAPGAGTLWWLGLLFSHPEIRMPDPRRRALHFFDRFCIADLADEDITDYHRHFRRIPGTISGEWTARYMLDPWAPPLLARAAPDARLLVMLADPIEHYRAIFGARLERFGRKGFSMADVAAHSTHAAQLEHLHRSFDPGQILVLQYERCRVDPQGQYRRMLQFLGVRDQDRLPSGRRSTPPSDRTDRAYARLAGLGLAGRAARRAAERASGHSLGRPVTLWPDVTDALHATLDDDVERLTELVPDLSVSLWPNFAHLA